MHEYPWRNLLYDAQRAHVSCTSRHPRRIRNLWTVRAAYLEDDLVFPAPPLLPAVKSAKGRTIVPPPVSQDRYGFENPRYQFRVTRMKFVGCGGCAERPRPVVSRRKPEQTDLAIHRMLRCARAYRPIQPRARGGIRNRQTSPPRATPPPVQPADGESETDLALFPFSKGRSE